MIWTRGKNLVASLTRETFQNVRSTQLTHVQLRPQSLTVAFPVLAPMKFAFLSSYKKFGLETQWMPLLMFQSKLNFLFALILCTTFDTTLSPLQITRLFKLIQPFRGQASISSFLLPSVESAEMPALPYGGRPCGSSSVASITLITARLTINTLDALRYKLLN